MQDMILQNSEFLLLVMVVMLLLLPLLLLTDAVFEVSDSIKDAEAKFNMLLKLLMLYFTYFRRRQKVVKLLQSSPVQVLLCLAVLLDAGIVIAQILLDLHAVKGMVHLLTLR